MSINPPIQPSGPPPVYCAECGCEVDPIAWLCATCGKPLHEPGAMTSTRPYAPATSKNSKPDRIVGETIFSVVLIVGFFVLRDGLKWGWIRRDSPGHLYGWAVAMFWVALLVILWGDGFFRRRRR